MAVNMLLHLFTDIIFIILIVNAGNALAKFYINHQCKKHRICRVVLGTSFVLLSTAMAFTAGYIVSVLQNIFIPL